MNPLAEVREMHSMDRDLSPCTLCWLCVLCGKPVKCGGRRFNTEGTESTEALRRESLRLTPEQAGQYSAAAAGFPMRMRAVRHTWDSWGNAGRPG